MSKRPSSTVLIAACLLSMVFASEVLAEKATSRPSPQFISVDVDGDLTESRVEKIVKKSMPRMRPCFTKAAKSGNSSTGRVQIRLLVLPTGRVTSATTERPGSSREGLRRCLQNKVLDIRFPRSKAKAYTTVRLTVGDKNMAVLQLLGSAGGMGHLMGGGGSGGAIFAPGKVHNFGVKGMGGIGVVGRGLRAPGNAPRPVILAPTPIVQGSMDRGLVRREVRRNINQIRFCYDQGLARDASLAGRITVEFTIGTTGVVTTASVLTSTMGDTQVEQCVVERVRRMRFPAPNGGGTVSVRYPFTFSTR